MNKSNFITEILETFVIAMTICLILGFFFIMPNRVDGVSMEATFFNGDLLLTNKVVQWMGQSSLGEKFHMDYKKGDIVIAKENGVDIIKRIIASGGDIIRIQGGEVYVNNVKLEEPYLKEGIQTFCQTGDYAFIEEGESVKIPANHYFIMGDNRIKSGDSRLAKIGLVPRENLEGKVFLRYWPLSSFHVF